MPSVLRPALAAMIALGSVAAAPHPAGAGDPMAAEDGYQHLVGALHEHSGYSDGWPGSTPVDYFSSGKQFGLDFMGSGEHSDNADLPVVLSEYCLGQDLPRCALADDERPANSFRKWPATAEYAREASDATFTAFRGFEWSSDRFGHINVYFSANDTNAKVDGGYATMDAFYTWLTTDPTLGGGGDGLATFNHPGAKKLSEDDPAFNWNDFAYVPAADPRFVGIEAFNGSHDYGTDGPPEGWYVHALDRGWHLGAVGAEDKGHDTADQWGGPQYAKTVLLATDRSPAALKEAMAARRMYAVLDNTIRLHVSADGRPMGARLQRPGGTSVPVAVRVEGGEVGRVDLVTGGGAVVASAAGRTLVVEVPVTDEERYYLVRVTDRDGATQAYSSPVWIEPAA